MHYLILLAILLLVVVQKNNIYETYKNQYKILRANANKEQIFKAINRIDEEVAELSYLIRKNKKIALKYDKMHDWYKNKLKSEERTRKKNMEMKKNMQSEFNNAAKTA